jgi:hypothetical protein
MSTITSYLKNHFFAIVVFCLLLIFIPIVIYFVFFTKTPINQNQNPIINPNATPLPSDFNLNYNSFNQLTPGKSTLSDVEKINGAAISSSKNGNETLLYYQTPSTDYKNTVVLKNGLLYYSLENVFNSSRGSYSDYISSYGQPDLTLYNSDSSLFQWYIFLKQGIGVEVSGNDVLQILYFAPESKNDFIKGIAVELKLTSNSGENKAPKEPLGF